MGTQIQSLKLEEKDFRSKQWSISKLNLHRWDSEGSSQRFERKQWFTLNNTTWCDSKYS
jgi:hypothetical protein